MIEIAQSNGKPQAWPSFQSDLASKNKETLFENKKLDFNTSDKWNDHPYSRHSSAPTYFSEQTKALPLQKTTIVIFYDIRKLQAYESHWRIQGFNKAISPKEANKQESNRWAAKTSWRQNMSNSSTLAYRKCVNSNKIPKPIPKPLLGLSTLIHPQFISFLSALQELRPFLFNFSPLFLFRL